MSDKQFLYVTIEENISKIDIGYLAGSMHHRCVDKDVPRPYTESELLDLQQKTRVVAYSPDDVLDPKRLNNESIIRDRLLAGLNDLLGNVRKSYSGNLLIKIEKLFPRNFILELEFTSYAVKELRYAI